jgi:hypothetical protein
MKPPVKNIEDLIAEWEKDCITDGTKDGEPSRHLLLISRLHAKYLAIYTHHRLILESLDSKYKTMRLLKWQYYGGHLNNPEDLKKYGIEPWLGKTIRADIPMHLDADEDLNTLHMKKVGHKEIIDFCASVIKELNNKNYALRAYIDFEKFVAGR